MFTTRPKRRKPAPVADSWRRLESWFDANVPEVAASLRPGCSAAEIKAFEKKAGLSLPDEVRESLRIHDGQEDTGTCPGLVLGYPLEPLESVSSNMETWRSLYDMEQESDGDAGFDDDSTSFPPDAIRCQYTNPMWVPMGDRAGNCYGIDLDPGPNGIGGQVIRFGRDVPDKCVLALSWAHFLEDLADELNIEDYDESMGVHFDFDSWSEAKLPAAFQRVKPVRKRPTFPGRVIRNTTARVATQAVEQFIQAMNCYEKKWLAVRPIHEMGYSLVVESSTGYKAVPREGSKRQAPVEDLELQKHMKPPIRQKKAIFEQHCTLRKRGMGDAFVQAYPLDYDPERDRIKEVRQVSPKHVLVYLYPVHGLTTRYHLVREKGRWLIDFKDRTEDHVRFKKVYL